jgi:MFS family permease
MFMTSSIMSKYVNALFGSVALTGALNAAFSVCAIVARIASGGVSDRKGAGWTMAVGSIILAVSTFVFGIIPVIAGMIVLRGLQGAGFAFASTGAYVAGTRAIPEGKMETGTSFLSMGASLATAVGPVIALALVFGSDFKPSFTVAGLLTFAAFVLAILFLRDGRGKSGKASEQDRETAEGSAEQPKGILRFIEPKSIPATVCQLINYLAQTAVNVYIVVWAESTGVGNGAIFFAVMAVAMCVVRFFSGNLMERIGAVRTAIGASLLSGIAYVLLLFCTSNATFLLSACLLGIGQGVFIPCMQFEAVTAAPADRTGVAIGTYQLANDIALGIGSIIWGLVVDSFGYGVMFVGCIVCIVISIPMAAALGKRTAGKEAED